jgi:hypothetical protein
MLSMCWKLSRKNDSALVQINSKRRKALAIALTLT